MNKNKIICCLVVFSSLSLAEDREPGKPLTSINFDAAEALSKSPEQLEKNLRNLEHYESYRPDSYSDAVRNPFQRKKYKFFSGDDE